MRHLPSLAAICLAVLVVALRAPADDADLPPLPASSPVPGMKVVCEDNMCRLVPDDDPEVAAQDPNTPFPGLQVRAHHVGGMDATVFAAWLKDGSETEADSAAPRGRPAVAALLLAAFFAGVLLNFSPCVLPMIPVTLSVLGVAASHRRRGMALGAAYGLGIAITYGFLGVLCTVTGQAIGTLQSSPWFSLVAAILLAAFALSLFGVLPGIDFSRFGSLRKPGAGSVAAAFGAGVGFALLGGACVAPVMLGTLVAAVSLQAEGSALGFALPFVLGAGCGAPWVLLGAGLSRWMPRPGAWMQWVGRVFGALLLALAIHYAILAAQGFRHARPEAAPAANSTDEAIPWRTDLAAAVAESRDTGRPLFVYAWATWCRVCTDMSRSTFRNPVAIDALAEFIPVKVQCEDFGAPFVTSLFDAVGAGQIRGLPMLAVLDPADGSEPLRSSSLR